MKKRAKSAYCLRNWAEYNAALKQRGSVTFWLHAEMIDQWHNRVASGKRGASNHYSDLAIATVSTVGSVYGLAGRQRSGFIESLFALLGIDKPVPDHT